MCEHCTLQKGCFYLFTFYLFTFYLSHYHLVILIHNILYRSFFISEREGCLLPLKADTNQVHSPIGLPFIGIGNGPYRLTDGSIIVGPGRRVSFPFPGPPASSLKR